MDWKQILVIVVCVVAVLAIITFIQPGDSASGAFSFSDIFGAKKTTEIKKPMVNNLINKCKLLSINHMVPTTKITPECIPLNANGDEVESGTESDYLCPDAYYIINESSNTKVAMKYVPNFNGEKACTLVYNKTCIAVQTKIMNHANGKILNLTLSKIGRAHV